MAKKRRKSQLVSEKLVAPFADKDMRWWSQVVAEAERVGKECDKIDRARWEARK